MIKLYKLIKAIPDITLHGSKETWITGVSSDSRLIAPGHLFIAKKGKTVDGARFIQQAVLAGAHAICSDLYDPFLPPHIPQLVHPRIDDIAARIADLYFASPAKELFLTGITGTNGKTTTAFLLRHLLSTQESPCGMIGTVEWDLGRKVQPALYTTPDVITNYRLLREMAVHGCRACVMEVSSHGLDQGRVDGLEFDTAIFTTLTRDHLDYHSTMENYAAAKARLFSLLYCKRKKRSWRKQAIMNVDDPWHARMVQDCVVDLVTYGIQQPADLEAREISVSAGCLHFVIHHRGKGHLVRLPMLGRCNVYNCLGAVAAALCYGVAWDTIVARLATFPGVPGRLEKVQTGCDYSLFVDFAHTPDALENALMTLREIARGRLMIVFGCGGDRDKGKREEMGAVASRLADHCIITSDNPRSEDPKEIIRAIASGLHPGASYHVELDRRRAIESAVQMALPGDIVLIAGKGHEKYQIVGTRRVEFDDGRIATEAACSKRLSRLDPHGSPA